MAGEIDLCGILRDDSMDLLTRAAAKAAQDEEAWVAQCLQEWQALAQREKIPVGFAAGGKAYGDVVSRMLLSLEEASRRIPTPRGFFTSPEDRRAAAGEVSRLLGLLEAQVQALGEIAGLYGRLLEALQGYLSVLMQTEAKWMLLPSVTAGGDGVPLPLDALREERARVEARLDGMPVFLGVLSAFVQRAWTAFCRECAVTADLSHNGEGSRMGELLQVLGNFRGAVGRLPHAPQW